MPSRSFLMDSGQALTTETEMISTRPLDDGKSFRLGYGYDKLSGERRRSCLDASKYDFMGRNIRTTESSFLIVNTKEDLAKQLNIEVNAEASGSYGTVTGSASSKTQILKQTNFTSNTILGIFSFMHRAQEIGLESDLDVLTEDNNSLLMADNKSFRQRCGDSYTKSVTTGAAMYILVEVSGKNSTIFNKFEQSNSVKAAFGSIFSASTTATVSKESKEILNRYNINVSCHSAGITSEACAQSMVAINPDDLSGFIDYINKAKTALSASVNSQPEMLVAVDEVFEDYPKPLAMTGKKRTEVFFDYSDQTTIVKSLLEKENQANILCNVHLARACVDVRVALADQMKYCARQEFWPDCDPASVNLDDLTAADNSGIGKVIFWEHYQNGMTGGKTMILDFDKPESAPNAFAAGKIYRMGDYHFHDIATGYQSSLREGWQLRVFEHDNGGGRCYMVTGASPTIHDLTWFNDKADSFRLEHVGDFPTSCD